MWINPDAHTLQLARHELTKPLVSHRRLRDRRCLKEWLHGESHAYHSPGWWKKHLQKTGLVQILQCKDHPRGRELWLDDVRRNLEERHPRDRKDWSRKALLNDLLVLLSDKHRFSTHLLLLAQVRGQDCHCR